MRRHGRHVNFSNNDLHVELVFNPNHIPLHRSLSESYELPDTLKNYFQVTQKGMFILRRYQILSFIMSKPSERFKAISSIIGIENLDEIELKMMHVRDNLLATIEYKNGIIDKITDDIIEITGEKINTFEDFIPILNKKLIESNLPVVESFAKIDSHAEEMLKTVKRAENPDEIRTLSEIIRLTKISLFDEHIVDKLVALNEKTKPLLDDRIKLELSISNLLEIGQDVIGSKKMDHCPLCEQKIDNADLLLKIKSRLRTLDGLSSNVSDIRNDYGVIIKELKQIIKEMQHISSKIKSFPVLVEDTVKLLENIKLLEVSTHDVISACNL